MVRCGNLVMNVVAVLLVLQAVELVNLQDYVRLSSKNMLLEISFIKNIFITLRNTLRNCIFNSKLG